MSENEINSINEQEDGETGGAVGEAKGEIAFAPVDQYAVYDEASFPDGSPLERERTPLLVAEESKRAKQKHKSGMFGGSSAEQSSANQAEQQNKPKI